MENLSRSGEPLTLLVTIPLAAYLGDHRVAGRVVLPAVEALQVLARTLPAEAGIDPLVQEGVVFAHLLSLDPRETAVAAVHEFSRLGDGRCLSRLTTSRSGVQARWTRKVEHAAVVFLPAGSREGGAGARRPSLYGERPAGSPLPGEGAASRRATATTVGRESPADDGAVTAPGIEGKAADEYGTGSAVFRFPARRLYEELVPFGPAYRNVTGEVLLTPDGVAAEVSGGAWPEAGGPLGSPFPLDAAFHLACAWGQRYGDRIVFPVGFERREILRPTRTGRRYRCLVVPLPGVGGSLYFDLGIFDSDGRPAEIVRGLRMRDIAGGSRRPPAWVREGL